MSDPLPKNPAATKRLEKEIASVEPFGIGALGYDVSPKTDVVLQYLAMSDEREYSKMYRTDDAISGAIEQRITGLMRAGDSIIEGKSHSPQATRLKEFAIHLFKGIPKFHTVRRDALFAIYYGWRPIEIRWTSDFRFEGRSYFGIAEMVAREPWHYHKTDEGALVLTATPTPQVFDEEEDALRFMDCTAGTTGSRYGAAWLQRIWLLYFLSKSFEKMGSQAMQRALGILKMTRNAAGSALNTATVSEAQVSSEVAAVLHKLNSYNVLIESQAYSLSVLPEPQLAGNITALFDHFSVRKRIAIVGQNLTSEVKGGSFAAEQGHGEILENYFVSDARHEADWWNDQVLEPAIRYNFGDVDADDMPRWKSKVLTRPNMEATRAFWEMGGTLDGKRLAEEFNVPALFEVTEEDAPLKKPGSPLLSLMAGGEEFPAAFGKPKAVPPPKDDEDEDEPPGKARLPRPARDAWRAAADDLAAQADQSVKAVEGKAGRDISGELAAYYSSLERAFLAENPDPKAGRPSG